MLESVKEQGDCIAKHIIMDGGSTDGTVERLKEWAAQNPYFEFVSEKDNGQADACQKALNRVETEYFIWLNADDVLLPGAAEKLLSKVSETDHASIVYGDYVRIDGEGKAFAKRRQPTYNYWDCLHGYLFVQNAAAMFNAIKLREVGGFDPSLRFVMDYDIILKLGKIGPVKHVKEFCGAFRVHETSKTSTIDDVCQKVTLELRIKYGVSTNRVVRGFCEILVKLRVSLRMLIQGCMKDRLY
jgi:glycosyltransferase involved in cell wall biosynthesis